MFLVSPLLASFTGFVGYENFFIVSGRGANDASRVRVQLSSSRVVNISSRARARVKLELESSLLESSFDRVLIESSPSSSRVVSFH